MPIAMENGFYQTHDLTHVSCLGIESHRLDECVEEIVSKKIKGVFGCPSFGFHENNLNFLVKMPWVEAIWFWDISIKDIEGLYSLHDLRHFGCHPKRPAIDFSYFKHLRKAIIELKPKDVGLEKLNFLDLLHIWHFKPKSKDFLSLKVPKSITEFQINWANPNSLETLPEIPNLKKLEIHRCRNLEFLGDLTLKYPNLKHFVIGACGKVSEAERKRVYNDIKK